MVLQRDQENKVWGKAAAGQEVSVSIADQMHTTTTGEDGSWSVQIAPLPAGGPHELTVTGDNTVTIKDVLVGEVWICSGQSNMEWQVAASENFALEQLASYYPKIRMMNFPNTGSQEPVWTHDNEWMVCSPETVGQFSAVGYFFGRQLCQTLDVPIGLVNNSWGGSACEGWIDRSKLEKDARFTGLMERWQKTEARYEMLQSKSEKSEEEKVQLTNLKNQMRGNQRPGNLYNGILKSHMGYGIRGAIWYQGESNAGRAYQYRDLFPYMIQTWREEWGQGDFPFYWVQLADFRDEVDSPVESAWAELREAQTMTLQLPNTAQAVIIDVGEGKDIHPRNKVTVGGRLARCALARDYGFEIAYRSPEMKSVEFDAGKAVVSFEHVGNGWRPFDVAQPMGFTIAGEDKKFVAANATILPDNRIEVSNANVPNPVAVRYAWADNPIVNLYTKDDLPLTPFRSDDWEGVTANNQ